jgi:hypothetical protein
LAAPKTESAEFLPPEPQQKRVGPTPFGSGAAAELGLKIPAILLEGDEPSRAGFEGPGRKFELATRPLQLAPEPEPSVLPEAYGTGRLFLTARDPHCLYAHWDLTAQQQRRYNSLSLHHHLLVRVYRDSFNTSPFLELHVHPESRHWFIHVDGAGANYVAELGYYERAGAWRLIAASQSATTPPDSISAETRAEFVTIPFDKPLPAMPAMRLQPPPPQARPETREAARLEPEAYLPPLEPGPGVEPPKPVAPTGPALPMPTFVDTRAARWELPLPTAPAAVPAWTLAQEAALAEVIAMSLSRREWIGSAEIEELLRKAVVPARLPGPVSSQEAAALGRPLEEAVFSPGALPAVEITSPVGGEFPEGFWFNVNAELVIYGATEPDARVSIGGRQIRLRPDGTFSYRFALPDGAYELPIDAVATHGDARRARLSFYRGTKYSGEVGAHPQDPALKAPLVQNIG